MKDELLQKLFANPKTKPDFEKGQTVRVISRIDVNMPKELDHWLSAKCVVLRIIPRGFGGNRHWCYELKHPNGKTCEFNREELDRRYRRRKAA